MTTASGAVRSLVTVAKSPATPAAVMPPTVIGVAMKWPTVAAPAVSARAAEPGDSIGVVPGTGVARGDRDDHVGEVEVVDGDRQRGPGCRCAPPPRLMFAMSKPSA